MTNAFFTGRRRRRRCRVSQNIGQSFFDFERQTGISAESGDAGISGVFPLPSTEGEEGGESGDESQRLLQLIPGSFYFLKTDNVRTQMAQDGSQRFKSRFYCLFILRRLRRRGR